MSRLRLSLTALAAVSALVAGARARAAETPHPGPVDPRIRSVFYNPLQVVTLDGFYGYQTMLEFGPGERIELVSIGDGLGWQVTPNKRATFLIVKPVAKTTGTNMTVVTNLRRYAFELRARKATPQQKGRMAYIVRFAYPLPPPPPPVVTPPAPPPPRPPERRNIAYSYTGAISSLPSLVFDDGRFTYFRWQESVAIPAIFQVSPDGSEGLVNYAVRDGYVVVEHLAQRFVLRNGGEVTTVINDGWRPPAIDPEAPRPHDSRTAREAARAGRAP